MAGYAEYFSKVAYKPTWSVGDRVFGKYKKMPFIGTVGNDTLISLDQGPVVHILLDLPLKINNSFRSVISVTPKSLKKLSTFK